MQLRDSLKVFFLTFFASILTVFLMFVGTPLLRVIHNVYGARVYWSAAIAVSAVVWLVNAPILAFLMFSIWLTVGLYGELELRGKASILAALSAIAAGSVVIVLGPLLWAQTQGIELSAMLEEMVTTWLNSMKSQGANTLNAKTIVGQVPSIMVIIQTCNLAFALMFDRRAAELAKLKFERISTSLKLLDFRLPDWMIWVMMISFLLSFADLGNKELTRVSLNIFNITMGFYLFQGLAVLEASLLIFRVGSLMKALLYIFIVGQLFFLLSGVGVIDYWADFRLRLRKWRAKKESQKNGEHI